MEILQVSSGVYVCIYTPCTTFLCTSFTSALLAAHAILSYTSHNNTHTQVIAVAMGGPALSRALRPFVANYRYYGGGLPDLLLLRVVPSASSDSSTAAADGADGGGVQGEEEPRKGSTKGGRRKKKKRARRHSEGAETVEDEDPAALDGVRGLSRLTGIPMAALLRLGRGERVLAEAVSKGAAAVVVVGSPSPKGKGRRKRIMGEEGGVEMEEEGEDSAQWPRVEWAMGGGEDGEWVPRLRTRRLGPAELEGVRCEIVLVRTRVCVCPVVSWMR